MLMDEEDVLLKAGDVVVQRGTNHAWSNKGKVPCVIAFILIDGVTTTNAVPESSKGIPSR